MSKGESKSKKGKKMNKKIMKKKRIVKKGVKVDSTQSGMGGVLSSGGMNSARSMMLHTHTLLCRSTGYARELRCR